MKPKIKYIVLGVIICLICVWVASLIKCEVLTHRHYDDFRNIYNQADGNIEYFKVLSYSDKDVAEVYYICDDNSMGTVVRFIYDEANNSWNAGDYVAGWSTTGNADDMIYPYWWHFIYGGF